ncbi:phospholipase A2 inhibitor and Ly6/PLAUR domain-containing protein-like [Oryzias latipes]|uniref:phospholipase A2 inhibitor and Ly6/PLAUR domain-containing protein-like n=1 Tax=Oryzias latipes TaxID=8090 RepID=UPI000CE16903|nr:phospholipase A2 inhibitor and Ly6/PLAUR domain-containing protein-like [Oryzias latipes]
MHLFALILGIWLLPKGDTLTCFECTQNNSRCDAIQRDCPSENHQCGVSRVIVYEGGSKVRDLNVKGCVLNEECGEGSGNSGYFNISVNTLCCNSNLCNTQSVPEPSKKTPNGRQCFTCDAPACNKTLDCVGNEDYCGFGTVDVGATYTINGCISKIDKQYQ